MANAKERETSFYIKVLIFFVLMFGFGFIPAPAPLTPYGMKATGIFIGLLYGYCAIEMIWTSMVGMLAIVLLDILPLGTLFASGWGSNVLLLIFFMMMLAKTLERAGISKFIALWFISRKIVLGRPWLFSLSFFVAVMLVTSMTSAVAMVLLGWVIFYDIASELSIEKHSPYASFMAIGIVISACLGDILFPFRTVGIVAFAMLTEISGFVLNSFLYTLYTLCLDLVFLSLYIFLGKFIFKIPTGKLNSLNKEYFQDKNLTLDKRQKAMLLLMILLIILMLAPSITPATWLLNIVFNKISATGIAIFICLLMCIIRIDGKPLMEPRSAIKEGVSFDVVFLGSAILPLALKVLSSPEAGINAFLMKVLSPIVEGKSGIVFAYWLHYALSC